MSNGELIIYTTLDGKSQIQLRAIDGTVWLTQAEMSELFQTTPQNITMLIKAIYDEQELIEESTCKEFLQVRSEGERQVQRSLKHYALDMIMAVGYRVRSDRGTQFRQWATTTLREYLVKGFVMDDERLKEPGGWDYFDELLQRIREIRTSEKRFYQKVKDLFTTSVDYDGRSETAQLFFKVVQNKMLWSVTGKTAAELIVERANPQLPNMGLNSWKGASVRKGDVTISKNYLTQPELDELNLVVSAFLELAEARAMRRQTTTMQEWREFVDKYLTLSEREVLQGGGSIAAARAETVAHERYEAFDTSRKEHERLLAEQEYNSEVDAELKQIEGEVTKRLTGKKKKDSKKTDEA